MCLSNCYVITDYFNILVVFWAEFSDQVAEYNLHKKDPVLLGYVLHASDQRACTFPAYSLEQTNTCVNGAVLLGSE